MNYVLATQISRQLTLIRKTKDMERKKGLLRSLCMYLQGYTDAVMDSEGYAIPSSSNGRIQSFEL